jgi:hypothetical protein
LNVEPAAASSAPAVTLLVNARPKLDPVLVDAAAALDWTCAIATYGSVHQFATTGPVKFGPL